MEQQLDLFSSADFEEPQTKEPANVSGTWYLT